MGGSLSFRAEEDRCSESEVEPVTPSCGVSGAVLDEAVVGHWLQLQSRLIAGLKVACTTLVDDVVRPGGRREYSLPEDYSDLTELQAMVAMAGRTSAPVVTGIAGSSRDKGSKAPLRVAVPLKSKGQDLGVIAVEVDATLSNHKTVLQLLEWGGAWLGLLLESLALTAPGAPEGVSRLYQQVVDQSDYRGAAITAVNGLAGYFSCDRVTLGWVGKKVHQIDAVSGLSGFSERSVVMKRIRDAMDECAIQGRPLSWPTLDGNSESVAHAALGAGNDGLTVCTLPIELDGLIIGSLSLERRAPYGFSIRDVDEYARIAGPLMQLLALQRERTQSWIRLLLNRQLRAGRWLIGKKSLGWKTGLVVGALILSALSLIQGTHRVAAPAVLEGAEQRAVVAPFEGYVAEAPVHAGEQVSKGQLLLRLEDQELDLERQRVSSERAELRNQYRQALAKLEHAKTRILQAQLVQADARLELLDKQLERTSLVAPIEGLIISGDWSRSLGMPVERGEVMFEVAPLDSYRVAIEVPDRDIAFLQFDQQGHLVLSALTDQRFPLRVTGVTSISTQAGVGAGFRVEADIEESVDKLRPGMQGLAKVNVGERSVLWLWTHRLVEWLRYQLWSWLP
ncbi:MAG: HlyD family efflux transporter periplasmic adaptor subunit [Gammaproteobacteria bacterium]|nr:HlyD family efflux transporter periplasmic adaptor subunit [Gammaproteobacteria bacterium]